MCGVLAQATGRLGNWFNQELYGRPTSLPWGLEIDPENRVEGYEDQATFHPTFLYECLWNLAAFAVLIWLDRRFRLGHGRVLALYVMLYTAGRACPPERIGRLRRGASETAIGTTRTTRMLS